VTTGEMTMVISIDIDTGTQINQVIDNCTSAAVAATIHRSPPKFILADLTLHARSMSGCWLKVLRKTRLLPSWLSIFASWTG
jgi:hypothetical protein